MQSGLREVDATADLRVAVPASAIRWNRRTFRGLSPDNLSSVITRAEGGQVEDLADLALFAMRDPHVRSLIDTRTLAVTGAELVVEPGSAAPEREAVATAAAEFCRAELAACTGLESLISHLILAEYVGWAGLEHEWRRVGNEWHSTPAVIEPRDISFAADWSAQIRTYEDVSRQGGRWFRADDLPPGTFMLHVPRKHDRPTVAGDFVAIAWPWLFKQWAVRFRQSGLERFGNPFLIGRCAPNTPAAARAALEDGLQQLSSDQWAVIEEGSDLEFRESSHVAGDAWDAAINGLHREMTVCLLGSDLAVSVGSSGGNRALGESQFSTTILPRLVAISKRLAGTIERDWFAHLLRLNSHLFGGVVPPVPTLRFQLIKDEASAPLVGITQMALDGGVLRKDELRAIAGLEPLGADQGGDEFVQPLQPAGALPFDREEAAAPSRPGHAHVEHCAGGEWRVVTHDGVSVSVHATKAGAVAALDDLERAHVDGSAVAASEEVAAPARPFSRTRRPMKATAARQLSLPMTAGSSTATSCALAKRTALVPLPRLDGRPR